MAVKKSEKNTTAQIAMESKRRLHERNIIAHRAATPANPFAEHNADLEKEAHNRKGDAVQNEVEGDSDEDDGEEIGDEEPSTPSPIKGKYKDEKFFMGHHKGNYHTEKGYQNSHLHFVFIPC